MMESEPERESFVRRASRKLPSPDETDFSLVLGGPLYQLLIATRLARPPLALLRRRLIVIAGLAWLPLLILSAIEGHAWQGVTVPFLKDVEAYARFLVAVPLLLVAEPLVHRRVLEVVHQFIDNGIIRTDAVPQFHALLERAMRTRNSPVVEIVLLVAVFVLGPAWRHGFAPGVDTWYVTQGETTLAGQWFYFVSAPIFQFLLLRWLFRLALWWRFLWRVSRFPLDLKILHPDRAGGLGFLSRSLTAFLPVMLAQSVVVSGLIFSRVLSHGATAAQFQSEIVVTVVLLVALIVGPLLFFSIPMIQARRAGELRFSVFATRYAQQFETKWLRRRTEVEGELLGSSDIQSMADLAGSAEILQGMRPVPFDLRALVAVALATASPFAPLIVTVIPLDQLLKSVAMMVL